MLDNPASACKTAGRLGGSCSFVSTLARRSVSVCRLPAARRERTGPSKNEQRRIAELEREVERAETHLKRLEDELADPAMWSSPSRTERNTARHEKAKRAVEQAYARWEEASGAK